jgi:hypothetical protein
VFAGVPRGKSRAFSGSRFHDLNRLIALTHKDPQDYLTTNLSIIIATIASTDTDLPYHIPFTKWTNFWLRMEIRRLGERELRVHVYLGKLDYS